MSKKAAPPVNTQFETSIEKLRSIVETIEKDSTSLADSLQLFEEGVALTREMQAILTETEQRVRILMETEDGGVSQDQVESPKD